MPAVPVIHQLRAMEDSGCSIMARVRLPSAAYITQAATTSVSRTVKPLHKPGAASSSSLTVSNVVFDTLQTGNFWTKDTTGYNFRDDISASVFVDKNGKYAVTYLFTPASGAAFKVSCIVGVENDPAS